MGQYRRKLAKGERWFYSGMYKGVKYHSEAKYLSKVDCRKEEAERLKEIEKEIKNPRDKMTLQELMEKRLDYVLAAKSKTYYKDTKKTHKKFLAYAGDIPLEKVSRAMIHEYLLRESTRLKKDKKDNYQVNYDLKILKALFNYAINELEVLDTNPTRKVKPYPIDKKLKYIPPDTDIDKVYIKANADQKRLITFCKESACRIGEALRATGNDIDLEMNLLTLWTRKKKHSNLTPRRIPLPEALKGFKKDGRLFPEWTDRPHFLEKICHALKIPVFGWHSFRHRKVSLMAKNNVPLIEIMNYLGHDNIETTQKYLRQLGWTKL